MKSLALEFAAVVAAVAVCAYLGVLPLGLLIAGVWVFGKVLDVWMNRFLDRLEIP